ncbi:MAG TPA: DEAD/DEAH box helicase [Mycobacteriales bacterium]|nr:DEAD/DEAH box helicase [Mycobacteriales bacterium]
MTAPRTTSRTTARTTARTTSRTTSSPTGAAPGRRSRRGSAGRPATSAVAAPRTSDLGQALDAAAARALHEPAAATTFAELGLPDRLVTALARRGMPAPFAIQVRAVPDALAGRDVLARGQTGSGKTLAFGLPLLARLADRRAAAGRPRGLVLVPTRELAQQVHDALQPLGQPLGVRLAAVYGGASMSRQITALRRGVDLVVATPGRLEDLIAQGECRLDGVDVVALDEADHMADLGFLPVVRRLLGQTPRGGQRLLFSATLDGGVETLVREHLTDPAVHAVAPDTSPVEDMDHRVFAVQADAKVALSAEIAARPGRTLFFVRTKHGADRLAKQLGRAGASAVALHGNLNQNQRRRALDAFTAGSTRVLVATDVAARGIHVDDVDLVVHFDPPADAKDYLHRSGRTARAGASGTVLSLVLPEQVREHQQMRERAAVTANAVTVVPGHPAVRELATSGTAIVVAAAEPAAPGGRTAQAASTPRRTPPRAAHPSAARPTAGRRRRSAGRPQGRA